MIVENLIIDNFSEIQIEIDSLTKDNNGNSNPDTITTRSDSNGVITSNRNSRDNEIISMDIRKKTERGERVREAETDEIGF